MIFGLTADQLWFVGITVVAVTLFIGEFLRVDLIGILIILALVLSGILGEKEAFAGFASEPAIIVAAVFVLSAGLSVTGVTDIIGELVRKLTGKNETVAIVVIMSVVAILSAFTHHLMITAMMLPIVMKICQEEKELHASRLLIPMATAASLGTTLTIIGAPAFLLANNILKRSGEKSLQLFSVLPLGIWLVVTGIVFCVLLRWILPKTTGTDDQENAFKLTEIATELLVPEKSRWAGKSVRDLINTLQKQFTVLRWLREEESLDLHSENPVQAGDVLIIRTNADELVSFNSDLGLVLRPVHKYAANEDDAKGLTGQEKRILKAVVANGSEFAGKSISQVHFYRRFGVVAVGLWRKSGWMQEELSDVVIRAGDMLVLWGPEEKLTALTLNRGFLMFLPFFGSSKKRHKAKLAAGIMLASICLAAFGVLPAYIAFLAGALTMVLSRCVEIDQAYGFIETKIFVMIAGVIPLGMAMEKTGVDKLLASQVLHYTQGWSAVAMLMVFYWVSAMLTQVLSDAATTVLLAPIAVAFAHGAGITPTAAV